MPKRNQIVQEILKENTMLDCGALSREIMDECIKQLPTSNIKSIVLKDFNHFKRPFGCLTPTYNYISKILAAIGKNSQIESLELGPEFCQSYHYHNNNFGIATMRIEAFIDMKEIKRLVLHNQNWHADFFKSLQAYLTNKACLLETLELKAGLIASDIEQLKIVFSNAVSLKHYKGAGEEELQAILTKKWSFNHNTDGDGSFFQMNLL